MSGKNLLKAPLVLPILVLLCSASRKDNHSVMVDRIVAKVNDHIILLSEVEDLHLQTFGSRGNVSKQDILKSLVTSRLVVSQAKREGITLNPDRVNQEIKHRVDFFVEKIGSVAGLEAYFGKTMREIRFDLRKQIGEQILVHDISNKVVVNLQVTPSQVEQFYETLPNAMLPESSVKYEICELNKSVIVPRSFLETTLKAALRIKNLASTKALTLQEAISEADASSDGAVAKTMKQVEWELGSNIAPRYENRVLSLHVGAISDVIVERKGVYLVQVIEKELPKVKVHELFFSFECDALMDHAKAEIEALRTKYLSHKHSNPEAFLSKEVSGKELDLTKRSLCYAEENLTSEIFDAFEGQKMTLGAVSRAVCYEKDNGDMGVKFFFIRKVIPPHKLNLRGDYDKISELCLESKRETTLASWMSNVENNSFVWVDNV